MVRILINPLTCVMIRFLCLMMRLELLWSVYLWYDRYTIETLLTVSRSKKILCIFHTCFMGPKFWRKYKCHLLSQCDKFMVAQNHPILQEGHHNLTFSCPRGHQIASYVTFLISMFLTIKLWAAWWFFGPPLVDNEFQRLI